jgi:quercetin dioxygenase-like cupin family protein
VEARRLNLGAVGMELTVLALAPGASGSWGPADGERFLYVIRGAGSAEVAREQLRLERESVLWLEPGEDAALEAGPDGLEALAASAPMR